MESLGGKIIAVDASIWIYQFQMAMRDKEGNALRNAHILGFLRRLVKLLFFGIRPIFVFDGGAPVLKKVTIGERRERKQGGAENLAKTAEKLLAAQMRAAAIKHAIDAKKARGEAIDEDDEGGITLGENTVYYDENAPGGTISAAALVPEPVKKQQKKDWHRDQYDLPPLAGATIQASAPNDARFATEDELKDFIDEMKPEDFDMDSDLFRRLPTEVQYEVIGDLRLKSRQTSFKRLESMLRSTKSSFDFSQLQIKNLMQRNDLTQKLFQVSDNIGKTNVTIPLRIAGERSREYVLIKKDDPGEGGGWALGVRSPKANGSAKLPVKVDTDSASLESNLSESEEDDTANSAEFEEVALQTDQTTPVKNHSSGYHLTPTESQKADRRRLAHRVLERKYGMPSQFRQNGNGHTRSASSLSDASDTAPLFLDAEPIVRADGDLASGLPSIHSPQGSHTASHSLQDDTLEEDDLDIQESLLSAANASRSHLPFSQQNNSPQAGSSRQLSRSQTPEPTKVRDFASPSGRESDLAATNDIKGKSKARQPVDLTFGGSSPAKEYLADDEPDDYSQHSPISSPRHGQLIDFTKQVPEPGARSREQTPIEDRPDSHFRQHPPPELDLERQRRTSSSIPLEPAKDTPAPNAALSEHDPFLGVETGRAGISMGGAKEVQAVRDTEPDVMETTATAAPDVTASTLPEAQAHEPADRPASDDEKELDWSPSPEPQSAQTPRKPDTELDRTNADLFGLPSSVPSKARSGEADVPEEFPFLDTEDPFQFDSGGEEEATNPAEEQDEFAKFLSSVKGASLESVQGELDKEIHDLNKLRVQHRRDADDISQVMVTEIQTLLRYFGIPYITAPMEAEAQCAELVSRGLASFCASEDSDLFLFGGTRVLKNVYNQNKYVECYLLSDLERELSLNREKLVQLAFLLGSDYTDGLPSVGPVTAMEILSEFPGQDGLLQFKEWWQKVQTGRDEDIDVNTKFRRKFKKKMKNVLFLHEDWPNPKVVDAYYHPSVDESDQPFVWGIPDLDALRDFLTDSNRGLGWSIPKVDELLLPIFKRINERAVTQTMQGTLDQFFDISAGTGHFAPKQRTNYQSERLRKIVEEWRAKQKRIKATAAKDQVAIEISSGDDEVYPVKAEYEGIEERLIGKAMANVKPIIRRTGIAAPVQVIDSSPPKAPSRPTSPTSAKSQKKRATKEPRRKTSRRKSHEEDDEAYKTPKRKRTSKVKDSNNAAAKDVNAQKPPKRRQTKASSRRVVSPAAEDEHVIMERHGSTVKAIASINSTTPPDDLNGPIAIEEMDEQASDVEAPLFLGDSD